MAGRLTTMWILHVAAEDSAWAPAWALRVQVGVSAVMWVHDEGGSGLRTFATIVAAFTWARANGADIIVLLPEGL